MSHIDVTKLFDEDDLMDFASDNDCEECHDPLDGIYCINIKLDKVCINCCACENVNGDFMVQTTLINTDNEVVSISAKTNHTWSAE
jgi:hypothetical protein